MKQRIAVVAALVVAIHVAALAVAFTMRESVPLRPIESHTITAELISPAPVPALATIQSPPTPPLPKPVPVQTVKPKAQPRPTPKPKVNSWAAPLPVGQAPSQHDIATPEPSPPAPAAPSPVTPAASAVGKPTLALSAPKNVSHLDCSIVQPDYPALSRRRSETGTAMVRFVVGLTGEIENIELKKSSGYDRLDQAALDAMHSSSCKPYLEHGEPIRAAYTQPFNFSLD
nr:energy transducer TonB [Paraburkholderia hospita]